MTNIHKTSLLLSSLFILFFASFFLLPSNASACTSDIDCPGGECTGRSYTDPTCDENGENCTGGGWSEGSCTTTTPPSQCEYFFCDGFCRRSQSDNPPGPCGGDCSACQDSGGTTPSPSPICTQGAIKETVTLANGCKQNIHYNANCTTYTGGEYQCPTSSCEHIWCTSCNQSNGNNAEKSWHIYDWQGNLIEDNNGSCGFYNNPSCSTCPTSGGGTTASPSPSPSGGGTTASPSPSPSGSGACTPSVPAQGNCGHYTGSLTCCTGQLYCNCNAALQCAPTCGAPGTAPSGGGGGGGSPPAGGGGGGSPPAGEPSCKVYTCSVDGVTVSASICCSCGTSGLCANNNTTISCGGGGRGNPCPPPPEPVCSGVCSAASPGCGQTTNGTDTGCGSSCSLTGGPCCSGVCSAPTVCGTTTYGTDTGCGSLCSVTGGTCPWWQAKDADLISQGDIRSTIPSSTYKLIDDGSGGYPGIAAYSGTISIGTGTLSSKDWKAQIIPIPYTGRRYDYEYFTGQVPPEVFTDPKYAIDTASINVSQLKNENKKRPDGYFWNYRNGDLSTNSNLSEMSDKVILIVNGNLTIGNNITIEDGVGFFGAIVKGNLTLDPQTSHPNNVSLEGIFLTDGVFATGAGSGRLYLRGSVIAWGGTNLQRDLGNQNSTTAAEYFEYAPDLLMTFPRELLRKGKVWREIAP